MDAPRENLVRTAPPLAVRQDDDPDSAGPVLTGHAAIFNRWYEIDSAWEGHFLERLRPGAFAKTIAEQGGAVRCLLSHGYDVMAGDNPLGVLTDLREDDTGLYYECVLFTDVDYVQRILPGLRANQYGASFRFWAVKEEWNDDPGVSSHNPRGIPERSLLEVGLRELGPTTWGANPGATAAIRSLSDHYRDLRTRPVGEPRSSTDEPPSGTRPGSTTATQSLRRFQRAERLRQIKEI